MIKVYTPVKTGRPFSRPLIDVVLLGFFLLVNGTINAAQPSGRFALVDHQGNAVSERSYDGKFRLVFFGFTQCPIICPTTIFDITQALKQIDAFEMHIQPIFITIDPERDTVETLAPYITAFRSNLVGLTGSPEQIRAAAKAFNVVYGHTEDDEDSNLYTLYHTANIYLMGRNGEFLDLFGQGTSPDTIAERLAHALASG